MPFILFPSAALRSVAVSLTCVFSCSTYFSSFAVYLHFIYLYSFHGLDPSLPPFNLQFTFVFLYLLFVLLFAFPLSTVHLFCFLQQQQREWLSGKIVLVLQINSSCLFLSLLMHSVQRGRWETGSSEILPLLALKNVPPLGIQGRVGHHTAGHNDTAKLTLHKK